MNVALRKCESQSPWLRIIWEFSLTALTPGPNPGLLVSLWDDNNFLKYLWSFSHTHLSLRTGFKII